MRQPTWGGSPPRRSPVLHVSSPLTWSVAQHAAAPVMALSVAMTLAVPPVPQPLAVVAEDPAVHVEAAAIAFAHDLSAVPADATTRPCRRDELAVRWSEPKGFRHGAHLTPVGPRPGPGTDAVNGVVVCGDSTWAYMGFEASRTTTGWDVLGVPYLEEEHGDVANLNLDAGPIGTTPTSEEDTDLRQHHADTSGAPTPATAEPPAPTSSPRPPVPSPSTPVATVDSGRWLAGLGPIEPYASYDPQTACTPVARPGTVALRGALLGAHPGTRNLGITRACHIGGRSEHKEGRAFDWGAYVSRPVERAAVERFIDQLFATDAHGNPHALARRMGVMYLVWNGRIWSAYRASEGWRPYSGPSPHTDHIHISLSRAGADGRTSFHTRGLAQQGVLGQVPSAGGAAPAVTPVVAAPRHTPTPDPTRKGRPESTPGARASTPRPTPTTTPAPARSTPAPTPDAVAERRDEETDRREDAAEAARREAERLEERRREEQRREARRSEEERRRLDKARQEEQRRAEEAARKAAEEARKAAEREAAEQQRVAERQARQKEGPGRGRDGGPPAGRGKGRGGGKG